MGLLLREFHQCLGARFTEVDGAEAANDYGDWLAECAALRQSAGVLDLSFRGRICLVGGDRVRFLHGQVTNDVKRLTAGEGCYAALVTAKGKMESDLNIYCLADELLLDFEPGLTEKISQRLQKFIVADDVQIVNAAPHYGLLSVQGPKAEEVIRGLGWFGVPPSGGTGDENAGGRVMELPNRPFASAIISDATAGEIYLMNHARLDGTNGRTDGSQPAVGAHGVTHPTYAGFDVFVPNASLAAVADNLIAGAKSIGGRACGWKAFETARIEAGIPRFGADMDETNLPQECGIEQLAVSYQKGCYIGQEVINRIHSFGHVTRELCGLRLANDLEALPQKHDKLFSNGRDIGYVTSAVRSPLFNASIALGYVRREANQIGRELTVRTAAGESRAQIVALPFV
ncbi:MAG: glycine cleavage T C-terminal barrel domain-containing protein [Verrucomicrobiota bacterium]|jgi:folate-binding protein YgfZ